MKELYENKEKDQLVDSIIEATKLIQDLEDRIEKLEKINNHLVKDLSKALGWNE
jgi:hypothetical protein